MLEKLLKAFLFVLKIILYPLKFIFDMLKIFFRKMLGPEIINPIIHGNTKAITVIAIILILATYGGEQVGERVISGIKYIFYDNKDTSEYNFEEINKPSGWDVSSDSTAGMALINPEISNLWAAKGKYSLQISVRLNGQNEETSKGEVSVYPLNNRPESYKKLDFFDRLDLSNKTIKASLSIPQQLIPKSPSRPININFFIINIKNNQEDRKNQECQNIFSSGRIDIKFHIPDDCTNVIRIGIKVSLNQGQDDPDRNEYETCQIFLDCVDW